MAQSGTVFEVCVCEYMCMDVYAYMHVFLYVYVYACIAVYAYVYKTQYWATWSHMTPYAAPICPNIAHVDSSGAICHHRGNKRPAWPNMAPYGQCGHMWAQHVPI